MKKSELKKEVIKVLKSVFAQTIDESGYDLVADKLASRLVQMDFMPPKSDVEIKDWKGSSRIVSARKWECEHE